MGYRAALLNFSKGEISPELEARFDLGAYQAGAREATNVKIRRTGGMEKRLGTRFVVEALSGTSKLFPFQFNDEQGYALDFGQGYMRPLALGGAILEEGLKITAITQAANAMITSAFHGLEVGDLVYLRSDDPEAFGMTEILDRSLEVLTVPSADTFTVDIDSTNFTGFGVDTGTVRVGPPDPPPPAPVVPAPATPPPEPDVAFGGGGGYTSDREWGPGEEVSSR